MKESFLIIFIFISILSSFSLFLLNENNNTLNLTIDGFLNDDTIIGQKGILSLIIEYIDAQNIFDPLDIEEKTKFKATISKESYENSEINCRLFKYQSLDFILLILCNIDETIPKGEYFIKFNSVKLNYKEYEINIEQSNDLSFEKKDINTVDIYSKKQLITVEDNKDTIELKFNIYSYNNENLFLCEKGSFYKLDSCKIKDDELICKVPKTKLEEFLPYNGLGFGLCYTNDDKNIDFIFLVEEIEINYNLTKKDVYVEITKLISNTAYSGNTIAYETNVTDISNVWTSMFNFNFKMPFNGEFAFCGFVKYEKNPLLMVCEANEKIRSLGKIEKAIEVNDINIKYNYKIQPVTNNEIIKVNSSINDTYFTLIYPEVLDFTSSDSLKIVLAIEKKYNLTGLRLNVDAEDLECEDFEEFKNCIVPKNHFKGKENGFYFISRKNHLNGQSICYEIPPVKIILPKENSNKGDKGSNTLTIVLCVIGSITLLALLIFIILCIKKKRTTSTEIDTEKEKLDALTD